MTVGTQQPVIHRTQLDGFLRKQGGKFVGLSFVKKDGQVRDLNGRLRVTRYLKGGENTSQALERPLLTTYDVKVGGYRNVDLSTMFEVRAQRQVFLIVD